MPAVVCHGLLLERVGTAPRIEELLVGEPGPGEVRIKMLAAGVCQTDLAAMRDAREVPLVLGHEGVGVVDLVGPGASALQRGTRVLLSWKAPCGTCRRCRQGSSWLCSSPVATSEPRVHWRGQPTAVMLNTGCLAEYCVVPASAAIPLAPDINVNSAAVIGCAVATGLGAVLRTARVEPGDSIAVWGAGGVGLNVVVGARLAHAGPIIAVDPLPDRRRLALALGATDVAGPTEAGDVISQATAGQGLDFAFEVTGLPEAMGAAMTSLGVGGQLVLVGASPRSTEFSFRPRELLSKQQRIIGCIYGSVRPHVDLPMFMQWYREGIVPVDDLIGVPLTLEELAAVTSNLPERPVRPVVWFG